MNNKSINLGDVCLEKYQLLIIVGYLTKNNKGKLTVKQKFVLFSKNTPLSCYY